MDILNGILQSYEPITLAEMDSVKLMDRTDTKYVFRLELLTKILPGLMRQFKVLEVEGKRISRYETLYFDTAEFDFYNRHQSKKLSRYKVRARKYVESDIHFLEIKYKNNKERTIKDRVKIASVESDLSSNEKVTTFIGNKTGYASADLLPVLWVNYSRITLVNNNGKERLTIDTGLQFVHNGKTEDKSFLVIAELKQERAEKSVFSSVMKQEGIRTGAFSKYCLGALLLYPELKQNNFKPILLKLKKLEQTVYA